VTRRWWVFLGVLVAGAVPLSVWLLVDGDEQTGYDSPEKAVLGACHADPDRPPHVGVGSIGADASRAYPKDRIPVAWVAPEESRVRLAIVRQTDSGGFTVQTCSATIRIAP